MTYVIRPMAATTPRSKLESLPPSPHHLHPLLRPQTTNALSPPIAIDIIQPSLQPLSRAFVPLFPTILIAHAVPRLPDVEPSLPTSALPLSVPPAQDGMEVVEPFKAGSSSYGNSRAIKDKSKDVEVASTSTTIVNDNVTGALASPPFDCNRHFETTAWCGRR